MDYPLPTAPRLANVEINLEKERGWGETDQIEVGQVPGTRVLVLIRALDTVATLRDKVYDKTGIPPDQQELTFYDEPLVNTKMLCRYDLVDDAAVLMKPDIPCPDLSGEEFQVAAQGLSGKRVPIQVKAGDAIQSVKVQIQRKAGTMIAQQSRLWLMGEQRNVELRAGRMVWEYGVTPNAELHLR